MQTAVASPAARLRGTCPPVGLSHASAFLQHTLSLWHLFPNLHAGLQSLDLRTNSFRRLPPALSAATGLTELSLAGNFHLALTTADVQGVLLRLPRLSRVYMGVTQTPAPVLWRLFTAAPALQVTESPGAAQWALAE